MSFEEDIGQALAETRIHRGRQSRLLTVGTTELPYILLNPSRVNHGDTVVRRGVLRVEEPTLLLLHRPMQFNGFSDDEGDRQDALIAVGRMAHLPPARYTNRDMQMDVIDGKLDRVLADLDKQLDSDHDERTGLVSGPVELWHLSLLVYVMQMVRTSAGGDVSDLARRLRENP